jgi:hypothetical protein
MIRLNKYEYEKVTALLNKWEERRLAASEYVSVGKDATLKMISTNEKNTIMKCIEELKQVMFDATT